MSKTSKGAKRKYTGDPETPRSRCPSCGDLMQKSGQKVDSNGVVKQRYLCTKCKQAGRTPYNYFIPLSK